MFADWLIQYSAILPTREASLCSPRVYEHSAPRDREHLRPLPGPTCSTPSKSPASIDFGPGHKFGPLWPADPRVLFQRTGRTWQCYQWGILTRKTHPVLSVFSRFCGTADLFIQGGFACGPKCENVILFNNKRFEHKKSSSDHKINICNCEKRAVTNIHLLVICNIIDSTQSIHYLSCRPVTLRVFGHLFLKSSTFYSWWGGQHVLKCLEV